MRHQVFGKRLNRDVKERKALFKSLINALIFHGRIKTTLAKAKAIQRIAEKLVTKSKNDTERVYSQILAFLSQKDSVNKLIKEIGPRFKNTPGGYLRLRRIGKRIGDATEEVILEWSKKEEKKSGVKPEKAEEKKVEKSKKTVKDKKVVKKEKISKKPKK